MKPKPLSAELVAGIYSLMQLVLLWEKGHQKGCQCGKCKSLREVASHGGLVSFLA